MPIRQEDMTFALTIWRKYFNQFEELGQQSVYISTQFNSTKRQYEFDEISTNEYITALEKYIQQSIRALNVDRRRDLNITDEIALQILRMEEKYKSQVYITRTQKLRANAQRKRDSERNAREAQGETSGTDLAAQQRAAEFLARHIPRLGVTTAPPLHAGDEAGSNDEEYDPI